MSVRDRDYAAAAEAFKNANRVIDEALIAGDGKIPEDELAKYAVPDGNYWLTETYGITRAIEKGIRFDSPTKVVAMSPIKEYTPNQISMYACVDGRSVVSIFSDGKKERNGVLAAARLTFRKADGSWRVQGYEKAKDGSDLNFQEVDQCDAHPN